MLFFSLRFICFSRIFFLLLYQTNNGNAIILTKGIKVYNRLLEKVVEYVNKGWKTDYKVEDVVGMDINSTFIFVHFNKEDYTKDAYPIAVEMKLK